MKAISEGHALKGYELVHGDRADEYARPYDDFGRIAQVWGAYLGIELSRVQVAHLMIGLKYCRLAHNPYHVDSKDDIVGYVVCDDRIVRREEGRPDTEPPMTVESIVDKTLERAARENRRGLFQSDPIIEEYLKSTES